MKTSPSLKLISLVLLAFISITALSCYGEDFFIDTSFPDVKNKVKILEDKQKKDDNYGIKERKSKNPIDIIKRKKIKTKYNFSTNREEIIPDGYYGKLPDIKKDFEYKKRTSTTSVDTDSLREKDIDIKNKADENLKPAPFDDSLFLDNIVKKEKSSNYVNDIQKTRHSLENLKKCIDENADIQRFNASVNLLDLYVTNLSQKYQNKSESLKESYGQIVAVSYDAKVLGNLLYEANYYAKYIPTQQGKYSKENIDFQKQKLLSKVNKTLFLIYQEE